MVTGTFTINVTHENLGIKSIQKNSKIIKPSKVINTGANVFTNTASLVPNRLF